MLKQFGGLRNGRCLDVESERAEPGGMLQVYPCLHKWHQTFSFGNGTLAPIGAIHTTVPRHIVHAIWKQGKIQASQLCLGVLCRSSLKPDSWDEDLRQGLDYVKSLDFVPKKAMNCRNDGMTLPLHLWKFKNLVTVPCSDVDNVIEFAVVPFIQEESELGSRFVDDGLYDSHREIEENSDSNEDAEYVEEIDMERDSSFGDDKIDEFEEEDESYGGDDDREELENSEEYGEEDDDDTFGGDDDDAFGGDDDIDDVEDSEEDGDYAEANNYGDDDYDNADEVVAEDHSNYDDEL